MRLFSLALGIVAGFGLGAWVISLLLPETAPQWVGVTLSMVWLFMLIFMVTLMSSNRLVVVKDQRRLLAYSLIAAVLMASFLVPVFVYKVSVPKWAAELVLLVIAAAVFSLSKYMERRKLHRTGR